MNKRFVALLIWFGLLQITARVMAQEKKENYFHDPFLQVSNAIVSCPQPEGPQLTRAEMRAEAHWRVERGTSCFQDGRCRLPNAYLYDQEIIPRVRKAILAAGRFDDSSIWVEGQRRWVWLKGCVHSQQQSTEIESVVRRIDDVEAVINQLKVVK
ncbi:MAG: BON domain-containing protein [Burkholderiales bacterium]|nr:BON domain-containing protein [Burkholderiales bacterium]